MPLQTVLGLVVGFGISWRASQGYANFQEGRQQWAQVIRVSRTLGRLCWNHVPERIESTSHEQRKKDGALILEEKRKFMGMLMSASEKSPSDFGFHFAGLIEAFAVATKHALRGEEEGIFYEDLYHLVSWLPQVSGAARRSSVFR